MNINIAPKGYEFNCVVFGVIATPYLAQFVAQHNAKLSSSEFPRAAKTACKSTYVDYC